MGHLNSKQNRKDSCTTLARGGILIKLMTIHSK